MRCFKRVVNELVDASTKFIEENYFALRANYSARPLEPKLCIGVMTTNRGESSPKFFMATIAALLRKISEEDRRKGAASLSQLNFAVLVYVVNNDARAEIYEEPYLLSGIIPVLTHYTNQSKAIQKIANALLEYRSNLNVDMDQFLQSKGFSEREGDVFRRLYRVNPNLELDYDVLSRAIDLDPELQHYQKQSFDYIFAMQACELLLKGNPAEYTLILEDDTFAADDFVPKIFDAIDTLTERKVQNWALLKLWYSKDFMGWENLDIFLLAFIGGTVFAISRYILAHMVGVRNEKLVNYSSIYCGLLFLGILIFIGKQNLSMDQKGVFETLANCCSPAHVYPQKVIQPLIDYVTSPIRDLKENPIDLLVDYFIAEKKMQKYIVVPNLFQHIGVKSSFNLSASDEHPFIWSETFDGSLYHECFPHFEPVE